MANERHRALRLVRFVYCISPGHVLSDGWASNELMFVFMFVLKRATKVNGSPHGKFIKRSYSKLFSMFVFMFVLKRATKVNGSPHMGNS